MRVGDIIICVEGQGLQITTGKEYKILRTNNAMGGVTIKDNQGIASEWFSYRFKPYQWNPYQERNLP